MSQTLIPRKERQLSNPAYRQYLYEKHQVVFSVRHLCFIFNGKAYRTTEPLMQQLHQMERAEARLNFYVLALFMVLLSFVWTAVNAMDSYVQSLQ
jgi:hypothetical protein